VTDCFSQISALMPLLKFEKGASNKPEPKSEDEDYHSRGSATKSKFVTFSTMFTTRVGTAKVCVFEITVTTCVPVVSPSNVK
jgi:hypothetical protein